MPSEAEAQVAKGFRKIGPHLQVGPAFNTNMQDAIESDIEHGVGWINDWKAKQLQAIAPTVLAMAAEIEAERNRLRREVLQLRRQLQQLQPKGKNKTNER